MIKKLCGIFMLLLSLQTHAFSLVDIKGREHNLSDYRGKWVLVNAWAPWCPRCKMEFKTLNDLDARPNFAVLGIAMDYGIDASSVKQTISNYNIRFPTILGETRRSETSAILQVGPVDYYPTSYLYNPDGKIVMFIPGIVSKTKLLEYINGQ